MGVHTHQGPHQLEVACSPSGMELRVNQQVLNLETILPALLRRSSSAIFFFDVLQGNLGIEVGNLRGILWDFSDPRNKGSKISEKISEHFS